VEAARAGEQGRGFAVVAAEVRSLAQRSAAAAKEIKALIAESVRRIEGGGHEAEVAGTSIDALVGDVKKVSALMSQIAAASTQQEQGIRQVSTSVTEMDRVVQQNAVAVHRSAAQGEKLRRDAHHLEEAMRRFTLPSDAAEEGEPGAGAIARSPEWKRLGSS
jgi:methyl-accepting chemotaxis protein